MRRATACVMLMVLALAGCGSDSSKEDAAAARARIEARAHARRMELGRRVFADRCAMCHTLAGRHYTEKPVEWEAPDLDEVQLKRSYVKYRVDFGGPAMASFTQELAPAEYRAVIDYVTETAGRNVVDHGDHPAELLAEGRRLFAQNCAGCHAIEGKAPTVRTVPGGRVIFTGMDFTLLKPSERYVYRTMKHGILPEEPFMPSFKGKLSERQMRAVAAYVTAVAKEGPEAPPPDMG